MLKDRKGCHSDRHSAREDQGFPDTGKKGSYDPRLIAASRELRDRYLEEINLPENAHVLPGAGAKGKYDVSRQLEAAPSTLQITPLLTAA